MASLLKAFPLIVVLLAAFDAVRIRHELPHRPTEPDLFLQALVIWAAVALLALVPAWVTLRLCARLDAEPLEGPESLRRRRAVRGALVLFAWTAAPVVAHRVLERHVGIGGDIAGLRAPRPWVEVVVALLAVAVALWLASPLLRRARPLALAAVLVPAAVAAGVLLPWRAAATQAGLASAADRPNVLLLIWDTVRASNTTPYEYERDTTPHLAELSARSTVYEQARSVSCFTFTSHLSMFSGVLPSVHGGRLTFTRYRPDRANVVAKAFQEAGYRTGGFVGTDVIAGRTGLRWGFERYDDQVDPPVCDTLPWALLHDLQAFLAKRIPALRNNGQPHWFQDYQRPGGEVLANALRWIRRDDPRPWFCMINLYDAHWPYVPLGAGAERFVQPYDGPLDGYLFRSDAWDPATAIGPADEAHLVDLYDAEIHDLDAIVDAFLGALDLDAGGTAVLMTSDHGEAFGEAGEWKHEDIFEPQVHVPFVVRSAEPEPTGRRVGTYVSGIDVAPTLLGLAGLGDRREALGMDGLDLTAGDPDPAREILVEDRDHMNPRKINVALYSGPWKLFRRGLAEDAVYTLHDLREDPVGEFDVSDAHPVLFAELSARLDALRAAADAVEGRPQARLSTGRARGLDALGYTGR